MPLYEYRCPSGHRFELIQAFGDPVPEGCETCGAPVKRLLSAPAVQFKGSGWYVSDYPKSGSSSTDSEKKSSASEKPEDAKTSDEPKKTDDGKKSEAAPSETAKAAPAPAADSTPSKSE